MPADLDQKANFAADFGLVFRSSAIFAVLPEASLTIAVLNYWKIKNNLDVTLVFTQRTAKGALIDRACFDFADCNVVNFLPTITEGSVEIEALSNRNARIPYAAIMGIYETDNSVSMVHAYARNHSLSEIEDRRAILEARESCITLRAYQNIETVAIFHNGNVPIDEQQAKLILTSQAGDEKEIRFILPALAPYETYTFEFERIAPDCRSFLNSKDGWAALHFSNQSAFPRLLVRWLDRSTGAVQVTHSNFDYSVHRTDMIDTENAALMVIPGIHTRLVEKVAVLYARPTPGLYNISVEGENLQTEGGEIIPLPITSACTIRLTAQTGQLPSRIVTAISGQVSPDSLPFECSLGVLHDRRPPKRFHWGVVSARHDSVVYLTKYADLYGGGDEIGLSFNLYGNGSASPLKRDLTYHSLAEVPDFFNIRDLFPDLSGCLAGEFGYITLFSNWGGFLAFTALELDGSLTIEHTF